MQKLFHLRKRTPDEIRSSDLSFNIAFDYPDAPESYMPFRAVGRQGNANVYSIVAPNLSKSDLAMISYIKPQVVSKLVEVPSDESASIADAKKVALSILSNYATSENKELIADIIAHDTAGYGPFSLLMEDSKNIEEIIVNDPSSRISVYHSTHGYCRTNLSFRGEREFRYMLNKMIENTGKEVNAVTPIIDAQLPDGSRVHAQLSPYAVRGTSASIRLSGSKRLGIKELLKNGTATPDALAYLWLSIEAGLNIIIAGAPSSGKTTLLSALCAFIPKSKRVITVEEDVNEVKIGEYLPNNVALQGASGDKPIHVNEQIINALHMRPDMLIIGEVRGQETKEVFFGANVGVPFATTMHSNLDSNALINRLISKPMSVEPQSLSALDLAVLMNSSGINGRKVEKIIEYKWLAKGEVEEEGVNHDGYIANEVFSGGNSLETIKKSKVLSKYASATMSSTSAAMKEMKRRAAFLNRLLMQEYESVNAAEYVRSYGVTL